MGLKDLAAQMDGGNAKMARLLALPGIGWLLGRGFVVITYVGRRSGKTISTPVNYLRWRKKVYIGVAMADKKTWWRNFLGEGAPISLHLNGVERTGFAVAHRGKRQVTVRVTLDDKA
ncbi:hypothetical protein [Nocardia inohanensis]|uniref:hypothetical protein n=1 Tax=Nocardia inohanensis TaxID=209246 RepID=UPI00082C3BBA|nr:hypothetical protein [Nocardia inohanensis]